VAATRFTRLNISIHRAKQWRIRIKTYDRTRGDSMVRKMVEEARTMIISKPHRD
jgi:hypothetical protein